MILSIWIRSLLSGEMIRAQGESFFICVLAITFGEIGKNRYTVYEGKILFTHGHQFRYPEKRTNYLESSRKEKHESWDPSRNENEVFMEAVKEAEKHGCRVVVFGHTHPPELDERTIDGIRIINVKAGCTYLHISVDSTYQVENN